MKLVLGAVQFGKNYGLVDGKKINSIQLKKIQDLVLKSNIKFIDTSANYGDSEKVIGNSKLNKLKVITKIRLPKHNINIEHWLENKMYLCLKKLKINKVFGILVHDYKDLLGYRGKKYLEYLNNLKKKKIVEKIGISIYSPNDLEKIWDFWKPEIVQVPFNILDQRIQNTGWISKLKKFGILVFARSCFLQGLLLSNFRSNKNFKKFNTILDHFSIWCKTKGISRLQACIDFVKLNKNIDYLVIGFNNYTQFDEILKSFNNKKIVKIPNIFGTNKLDLIDPRRWR
jgi:aryl-alcohol dehydrogenase-like predicted oxidoreductase